MAVEITCKNCGGIFYTAKSNVDRGKGKYCSRKCAHADPDGALRAGRSNLSIPHKHIITDVDEDSKTGFCKECNEIVLVRRRSDNGFWRCTKAEKLYSIKQKYGIDQNEYAEILRRQHGLCAICGGNLEELRLVIDHCHESGRVRGLLCHNCNVGIGMLKDDISILSKAISYLAMPARH